MIEGIDVRIRYAKEAGIPDAVVMELVGHESAAMSHRYTHVGKEALSKAAKSLPEI
jgi:site-specific recombinase XerD